MYSLNKFFLSIFFFSFSITILNAQFAEAIAVDGCNACANSSREYADFDNDGDKDFVIVLGSRHKIILYTNDGNNNFTEEQIVLSYVYRNVEIIGITDINEDGDIDILLNSLEVPLFYLENDGTGHFYELEILSIAETDFEAIYPCDYEGDGDIDLILLSEDGETISYYLNSGGGDFSLGDTYVPGFQVSWLYFADVDGDADEDILIRPYFVSNSQYWLEKLPEAGYTPTLLFDFGEDVRGFEFKGDYNGDGWVDGIKARNVADDEHIGVRYSQNGDLYSDFVVLTEETGMRVSINTDYDNDGDIDVLGGYKGDEYDIFLLENPGDGILLEPQSLFPTRTMDFYAYDDFDGDGFSDFWTFFGVQAGNSDENYTFKQIFGHRNHVSRRVLFEDIDGDGKEDFLRYSNYFSATPLSMFSDFAQNGINDEVIIGEAMVADNAVDYANHFDFVDLDNDGDKDLLASFNGLGDDLNWYEYVNNTYVSHLIEEGEHQDNRAVDYDGDGDIDVISYVRVTQQLRLFLNDGNGNMGTGQLLHTVSPQTYSFFGFEAEDLGQDGDMDLVIFFDEGAKRLINDGNDNFTSSFIYTNDTEHFLYEDINADGYKDITYLPGILGGSQFLCRFGQSNGSFSGPSILYEGEEDIFYNKVSFMDYDNDGDLDMFAIAQTEISFAAVYSLSYFENDGTTDFLEPTHLSFSKSEIEDYAFCNYDNDDATDLMQCFDSGLLVWTNLEGKPSIQGRLFEDEDGNGIYTVGESLMSSIPVTVEPEPVARFTDEIGHYRFFVNPGDYTVAVDDSNLNCWELTTEITEYEVSVGENSPVTDTLDFGFTLNASESEMKTSIVSGVTRCGFTIPFWLTIRNSGCLEQDSRYAIVLDPLVTYLESVPSPAQINGDTLFFETDSLIAGESQQALLTLKMPEVEEIGNYINMESIAYLRDENGIFQATEAYEYISQIVCAYDPNDKQVSPANPSFDENYTLFGEELTYTVRFQNTGTDTAFNIVIRDTLDSNLDWTTFRPLDASHDFLTEINQENGAVLFNFPDILLPDSIVNQPGSHGYVRYAISPNDNLPESTVIDNTAHIYFDFNPAIVTNTIVNTFVSGFIVVADVTNPTCIDDTDGRILAQFPFGGDVNYQWSNGSEQAEITDLIPDTYSLTVTDNDGMILVDTSFVIAAPELLSFENVTTNPEFNGNANGTASVTASGGVPPYTYEWSTGENSEMIENLTAGDYTLTLTDAVGCSTMTLITILFTTGTENVSQDLGLYLYPNPAQNYINIRLSEVTAATATKLTITDAHGRILQIINGDKLRGGQVRLPTSLSGVYFVSLEVEGVTVGMRRFVVVP